jgi:hypothetical protein
MNGVPSTATAYSKLAIELTSAKLPAMRQTKTSPRPMSKAYSGPTRESHDRLLLGLKRTMSEFELGLLRQRAQEALRQYSSDRAG